LQKNVINGEDSLDLSGRKYFIDLTLVMANYIGEILKNVDFRGLIIILIS